MISHRNILLCIAIMAGTASGLCAQVERDRAMILGEAAPSPAAPAAKLARAAELLLAAKATQGHLQALLARQAMDLARPVEQGALVAAEAAGVLLDADPANRDRWRQEQIAILARAFDAPADDQRAEVGRQLLDIVSAAAHEDAHNENYQRAEERFAQAATLADSLQPGDKESFDVLAKWASAQAKLASKMQQLHDDLAADPANLDARRQLIMLHLADRDDPQSAADLGDVALPDDLRRAIRLAAQPVDCLNSEECFELIDFCRQAAGTVAPQGRGPLLARAKTACYVAASIAGPGEADHARARKRLAQLAEMYQEVGLPGRGPMLRGAWVELVDRADPSLLAAHDLQRHAKGVVAWPDKALQDVTTTICPRGDYDLAISYERTAGAGDLVAVLPAGEKVYELKLSDQTDEDGATSQVTVSVRTVDNQATIQVNGQPAEATEAKAGDEPGILRPPASIAFRTKDAAFLIRSVRLRMVTGMAERSFYPPVRFAAKDIQAKRPWTDVLAVRQGDEVEIAAEGLWSAEIGRGQAYVAGPDGKTSPATGDKPDWYLEGRIAEAEPFTVGSNHRFTSATTGMLQLQMHDAKRTDNHGHLAARVRILRRQPPKP